MERLAAAVRVHEGTTVELIVAGCLNGFSAEDIDFLATMSRWRIDRSTGTSWASRP